jgi:integrase
MPKLDAESKVAEINDRLKDASIRVRVRLNGTVLGLRATLPLKQGMGKQQQDIRMGIPATKDGFKKIEAEAHKLSERMIVGTFDWKYYTSESKQLDKMPVSELLPKFREHYLRSHSTKPTTYKDTWEMTFRKLPQDEALTDTMLLATALSTETDSNTRKLTCQRLQTLAEYADIKIDLLQYQGNYGAKSAQPRNIPRDAEISEWRDRIPNESWQWFYGMMATFGLRPHEVFFCEFPDSSDPHTVDVLKGKTGYHRTHAILPEWSEQWNLIDVKKPLCTALTFKEYGARVKRQFNRYGVPFHPYDLRHAFAIRGSVVKGLPVSTMAAMMGHSPVVHQRTYHRWLSNEVNDRVYRDIILKKPEAP